MTNVIRSRTYLRNEPANTISAPFNIDSIRSSVVFQVTGNGAVSALVNVYTGVWDFVLNDWAIKTLDSSVLVSGTDFASGRINLKTLAKTSQIEIQGLSGTNARVSAGLIQTNGGQE